MLYFFTENYYCIAWIKCCWQCTKPQPFIFYPKLSDLVLLVMHNACDTPIERYLWFVQWRCICNERKERDPNFLCTNENTQLQSAGGMGQLGATNWGHPDELTTIIEVVNWLVKLRSVSCVQLSLIRLKALKHNSNCSGHPLSNG